GGGGGGRRGSGPPAGVGVERAGPPGDGRRVAALDCATAGQEDVEPAVAVVVEEGHPAAERFEDRVPVGLLAVAIGEGDPAAGGHVLEHRRAVRFPRVRFGGGGGGPLGRPPARARPPPPTRPPPPPPGGRAPPPA